MPIPGTRSVARLQENAAAAEITLTTEEIRELTETLPEAAGTRYPEAAMAAINR